MISKTIIFMKLTVLILAVSFWIPGTLAQVERTKVLGGYIYNFAKLTSSPKQKKLPKYKIVVISDNDEIKQEFGVMEAEVAVDKKKIVVAYSSNANKIDLDSTCMIFVGEDKLSYYTKVFNETKGHEILLVTENYDEKQKILLNLYETEDGKMLFEMNKGNIYERKIKINDEILLMGGSEIDLVELYLSSQAKLNLAGQKLQEARQKLDGLMQQVQDTEKELDTYKAEITQQQTARQKLTDEIKIHEAELIRQKKAYIESEQKLIGFNDSLKKSKDILSEYKNLIKQGDEFLKQQEQEIANKEEILNEKNIIINRQRNTVTAFIIGLVLVSLLTILLLINYSEKKKKNKQLKKQQIEIISKNKALEEYNEEIKVINEEVHSKNEELTVTLDEIKRIQNQLVQSEKMASLGVLSAGIAHEINNPINFVYAGINSLLRDFKDIEPVINEVSKINPDTDELQVKIKKIQELKEEYYFDEAFEAIPEIIKDIKIGADRTAEIVKGLKSFSRVDKTELQTLNIHEGLDTSLLLLKNKYKNHIEVIKEYDSQIPLINCFPGKINQAFLNIISNAIDSIAEKGKIWITTEYKKNKIQITIKDNGCGMPKEMLEKVFDPFFTTKPVGKGTGLGLSITYGIINDHHGKISVKSEPDKGSKFIISLPIK
jgi:signal transduction histidine kinase